MGLQEPTLIDAIMGTRGQIDFLWQFFVTVQIAVFALLLIYDEAVEGLSFLARLMATAGIALFDWINGKALVSTYLLLDAMLEQYRALFGQADRFHPLFYDRFVQASFTDRPDIVQVTHGLAFAVVTIALFWRGFIQRRRKVTA